MTRAEFPTEWIQSISSFSSPKSLLKLNTKTSSRTENLSFGQDGTKSGIDVCIVHAGTTHCTQTWARDHGAISTHIKQSRTTTCTTHSLPHTKSSSRPTAVMTIFPKMPQPFPAPCPKHDLAGIAFPFSCCQEERYRLSTNPRFQSTSLPSSQALIVIHPHHSAHVLYRTS